VTKRAASKAKKVKVIGTTFFPPPPPPPPPTCAYEVPGEGRCPSRPEKYGYCHRHIRESPQERAASDTLMNAIRQAKQSLDDCGDRILLYYVALGEGEPPEETKRDYRVLWHRHHYLVNIRNSRRVGDELPAEVTMR
jgi:hypothetical protein